MQPTLGRVDRNVPCHPHPRRYRTGRRACLLRARVISAAENACLPPNLRNPIEKDFPCPRCSRPLGRAGPGFTRPRHTGLGRVSSLEASQGFNCQEEAKKPIDIVGGPLGKKSYDSASPGISKSFSRPLPCFPVCDDHGFCVCSVSMWRIGKSYPQALPLALVCPSVACRG